jgi:hypothetical protein
MRQLLTGASLEPARSNMACLPNQVDDGPVIFALLKVIEPQLGQLATAVGS